MGRSLVKSLYPGVVPMGISFTLSACGGTIGTIAWRDWDDQGTKVTEVRSAGVEMRNLPGYKGALIGCRRTVYGSRSLDPGTSTSKATPWKYGWAPAPPAMPIHLSQITYGLETGWEPSFKGASLGISSRSISILPADGDEILEISYDSSNSENTRIKLQQHRQ